MNGSGFGSVREPLTLYEGFTIPKYSKCIFINYTNSNDGALIAIKGDKTYTAFRNNSIWQDGKILITNTDLDTRLPVYYSLNGVTKIKSLPFGIYNLSSSEITKLTDRPAIEGRSIIITSGIFSVDEKVALILASHKGDTGGVYFGYIYGNTVPEFSWKKIVGNT